MWCWKDSSSKKTDNNDKDINEKPGLNEFMIKEWEMILRENKICMDEYNVDIKKEKIDCEEQSVSKTRLNREQETAEREMELLLQQQLLVNTRLILEKARFREKEIEARSLIVKLEQRTLDNEEKTLEEKNGMFRTVIKLNEQEPKTALQLMKEVVAREEKLVAMMFSQEQNLDEREQELFIRVRDIEHKEFNMKDKEDVLEFAIQKFK